MRNKLRQYFSDLNDYFSLNKILINSYVSSFLLIWIDYDNLISKLGNNSYGKFIIGFTSIAILSLVVLNRKRLSYSLNDHVLSEADTILISVGINLMSLLCFRVLSLKNFGFITIILILSFFIFLSLMIFRVRRIGTDSSNKINDSVTVDLQLIINNKT